MTATSPELLIRAVLCGDVTHWNNGTDPDAIAQFLEVGRHHGVLPLLDRAFRNGEPSESWPEEILHACRQAMLAQAGYEIVHGAELDRVLADFAGDGIAPLLLKGTALAYSLYASPALRPRSDTDMLVAPDECDAAWSTLKRLGYRRVGGPAGKFVGYQLQAQRVDARGIAHNIDLHWRIRDEQSFAWLFDFAELAAAAVPLPALNAHAARLGNAHALFLGLLHRASNNRFEPPAFGDRLIWLYDLHLLVQAMSAAERDDFRSMVAAKRVGAIALEGLRACAGRFSLPSLLSLVDALARSPDAQSGAEFLTARRLRREWIEWRAIPGAGTRVVYLASRAFPAAEYMRERYPETPASPLPLLHLRRWIEGIAKAVRRHPDESSEMRP